MASILKQLACAAVAFAVASTAVGAAAMAQSSGQDISIGGHNLQGLAAQKLTPGRCGLFLWSKTERPVFILFATENPAQALMRIGGRDRKLSRKAASGQAVLGHYEKQTFAADKYSFEVDLTYRQDDKLLDGAVIERGIMRTRDKAGMETILPIGGMIACQKA